MFQTKRESVRKRDSSVTRVGWLFATLVKHDRSGRSWLPGLLGVFPNRHFLSPELLLDPGRLVSFRFGNELPLAPPLSFIKWLVQSPEELTWPKYEIKD